jgi:hypothetical protein
MNSTQSGRVSAKLPSSENDVKDLITDWFKVLGGFSVGIPSNGMGKAGISDRIGVIPITITPAMVGHTIGLAFVVEAKKPGRRGEKLGGATQAQVDFLKDFLRCGAGGGMVDCEPDLRRFTQHLGWLKAGSNHTNLFMQQLHERLSRND